MKTGRPEYPIPSPQTVSKDVRNVFVSVRKRIAKMLQVSNVHFFTSMKLNIYKGACGYFEFRNRCVDFPKS
jgi:hypothetical protein